MTRFPAGGGGGLGGCSPVEDERGQQRHRREGGHGHGHHGGQVTRRVVQREPQHEDGHTCSAHPSILPTYRHHSSFNP
jgi:hypothetical protein